MRKPPSNILKEAQYTSGGDFIDAQKNIYVGYYSEVNGAYFKGRNYTSDSEPLLKIDKSKNVGVLLNVGLICQLLGIAGQLKSHFFKPSAIDIKQGYSIRYFSKQLNINPILIKEINKDTFDSLKNNSLYQIINLNYNLQSGFNTKELEETEKKMPGIKDFVKDLNVNPTDDYDNYTLGQG